MVRVAKGPASHRVPKPRTVHAGGAFCCAQAPLRYTLQTVDMRSVLRYKKSGGHGDPELEG